MGDIMLNLKKLAPMEIHPDKAFADFRVGDEIRVIWSKKDKSKESYRPGGIITQISDVVMYYRCEAGYICAVNKNQMLSDVKVTVIKKAKVARNRPNLAAIPG
jgi:hypothetical protein